MCLKWNCYIWAEAEISKPGGKFPGYWVFWLWIEVDLTFILCYSFSELPNVCQGHLLYSDCVDSNAGFTTYQMWAFGQTCNFSSAKRVTWRIHSLIHHEKKYFWAPTGHQVLFSVLGIKWTNIMHVSYPVQNNYSKIVDIMLFIHTHTHTHTHTRLHYRCWKSRGKRNKAFFP